ncbi:MAG: hypothetical protein ACFFBS_02015 [Promethearchaeota archaeon]
MSGSNNVGSIESELQKRFDSFIGALDSVIRKLESGLEDLTSSSDTRLNEFSGVVNGLKSSFSDFLQKSEEQIAKLVEDSGRMSRDLEGLKTAGFDKVVKEFENLHTQMDNLNTQVSNVSSRIENFGRDMGGLSESEEKLDNVLTTVSRQASMIGTIDENLNKVIPEIRKDVERVIDMTAALTTELTAHLDAMNAKIESSNKSQESLEKRIGELESRINNRLEKISTVIESRLDGLRKQFDEDMIRWTENTETREKSLKK